MTAADAVGVADGTAGELVAVTVKDAETFAVNDAVGDSVPAAVIVGDGVNVAVAVAENGSAVDVPLALAPALSDAVVVALAVAVALTPRVSVAVLVAVLEGVAVDEGDASPQHVTSPAALSAHDHVSPALTPTMAPDEAAAAGMGETWPLALRP